MFTSVLFIIFLMIIWLIYCVVPKDKRSAVLLIASYGFVGYISLYALVALVISTCVSYIGGRAIEKAGKDRNKMITMAYIFIFAVMLVVVKNIPYVIKMFKIHGISEDHFLRRIILPVGFSFYAFQAIGYMYDVYREKEKAEKNIINFALYMSFFAKLVSGPIERKGSFIDNIKKLQTIKILDSERLARAFLYMIWGYFLKLVVADRLALIVNQIHATPVFYDVLWLVGGAVFYSFQVYSDFAGYTCIAIGCAYLFGIELTQNFKCPYMSKNITEFWRRWHISLSSWLRDYLYIPLGGNRKGKMRKYLNTIIVFLVCGIWHGNGLSFVAWGLLHGIYSLFDNIASSKIKQDGFMTRFFGRVMTFIAVTFAWIFFRAESLMQALEYIRLMFTNGIHPQTAIGYLEYNNIVMLQVYLSLALIIIVMIADIISYRKDTDIPDILCKQKTGIRYLFAYICILVIFVIGIYGGDFQTETFIYMQF